MSVHLTRSTLTDVASYARGFLPANLSALALLSVRAIAPPRVFAGPVSRHLRRCRADTTSAWDACAGARDLQTVACARGSPRDKKGLASSID